MANPAGPAGTGKTEACKDIAKVLGKWNIVINCNSAMNCKIFENLMVG